MKYLSARDGEGGGGGEDEADGGAGGRVTELAGEERADEAVR